MGESVGQKRGEPVAETAWPVERIAPVFWRLKQDLGPALVEAGVQPDVARLAEAVWHAALLEVADGTRLLPPEGYPLQFAGIDEVAAVLNGTDAARAFVVRARQRLAGRLKFDPEAALVFEKFDSAKHLWDMPACEACGGHGRVAPAAWAARKVATP
jgi:hypothetical protein